MSKRKKDACFFFHSSLIRYVCVCLSVFVLVVSDAFVVLYKREQANGAFTWFASLIQMSADLFNIKNYVFSQCAIFWLC